MSDSTEAGTSTDTAQPDLSPGKMIRAEILAYEKEYKPWMDRAKGVIDRYRDIRPEPVNQTFVLRKYNILWANVRVLRPTLYARIPEVQVERRFKDQDPTGRLASEIAERMGNYILQTSDADAVFKECVEDNLLPGRGQSWISYEVEGDDKPLMEDYQDETGATQQRPKMKMGKDNQPTDEPETEFEKIHEAVNPEYVDWEDFGHSPVRRWRECKTVWRKRFLNKEELIERFGEKTAATIPLDLKIKDVKEETDTIVPQATIYEAWHKPTKKVYWLHQSVVDVLDEADPPITLEGFWPCPAPLWATTTNKTLIPIPDFIYYQDQANELDIVTNRIARITDAIKAVGVYDSGQQKLERILQPNGTPDNMLVPVDQWAAFMEKGGLQGAIQLVPIDMLVTVLQALYGAREQIIQVIFQITGIADIIRGSTDPNETLGAQKLKGQYGSINIRDRQAEVAAFCRDTARLIIECGIQMFEPKLIAEMTMATSFCPLNPQEQQSQAMGQDVVPQSFLKALQMLKSDRMRTFHIDIETDSTIALNDAEEKAAVAEFTTAVGQFFQSFGPIIAQEPALTPVAGELLLYGARRFRAGRALESAIEQAVKKIEAQTGQPKPPDPKMMQAQAQAQAAQAKSQSEQVRAQADVQIAQADTQKAQIDAQAKGATTQAILAQKQQDMAHKNADLQLRAQGQQFDQALAARDQAHQERMDVAAHNVNVVQMNKPKIPPK